jgi:hypothetical protein
MIGNIFWGIFGGALAASHDRNSPEGECPKSSTLI